MGMGQQSQLQRHDRLTTVYWKQSNRQSSKHVIVALMRHGQDGLQHNRSIALRSTGAMSNNGKDQCLPDCGYVQVYTD
jgi:hypothetical protein